MLHRRSSIISLPRHLKMFAQRSEAARVRVANLMKSLQPVQTKDIDSVVPLQIAVFDQHERLQETLQGLAYWRELLDPQQQQRLDDVISDELLSVLTGCALATATIVFQETD